VCVCVCACVCVVRVYLCVHVCVVCMCELCECVCVSFPHHHLTFGATLLKSIPNSLLKLIMSSAHNDELMKIDLIEKKVLQKHNGKPNLPIYIAVRDR